MSEKFSPRDLSPEEAQRLADAEKPLRDAARDPKKVESERRSLENGRWEELSNDYDPDEKGDDSYKASTEETMEILESRAEVASDRELDKIVDEKSSQA